ncbi:T9SS-dependent choice-of-anchor J family protein [Chryseobacterium indoltheticum]|uniref:Por secretion system C-terminal sorting domain n=1 Tax=Chryseobacterium indoltheticum TaxID=254 RepID=A0A381FFW2_9FLAO|nr:T9SS type A sorting domain-containing protein [Chryseobacterium indoltheticum]AZA74262.1 T9SS C-terminal target domain-containing protein [Chryseobacterium indoltheticum]SIR34940.1 Por secretion system C-terminal sorting domain-containing protein [Chryseobacterium indoltheticum]SUX45032.1 Por secretion system C-terminal sorting domain [Chryseobacterium indoltheticum]
MKKIILLSVILLSKAVFAQIPVWMNTFETPSDLQGWTFYDTNGNGNGWMQGQNIYHNGTSLAYGTAGVLRHSINLVPTGNATGFATENDWIVSPEIDLTNVGGTITLAGYIGRQRSSHASVSRDLYIFVSTSQKPVPGLADFQQLATDAQSAGGATYRFSASSNLPSDLTQFAESLVNISAFAGKKIYIGLWSNRISSGGAPNSQNINIDEMAIYASVLSTKEVKTGKALSKIIENPVSSSLQIKLDAALKENNTTVSVYNMGGQQILKTKYSKNINVAEFSAGTYIVEVSDRIVSERMKFIKK